ncbi:IniB N-terminal domain-containing protein [Pseudonocardia oroxyli]|uniref:Uncharacterized protein n=1 Tax=Pseudonocardia oroxyli TaxID=366584 RepID=A0A1G7LEW9_PSEOR|nr:IniB N-terminal domain-containing protein [Pseudonocardia oroxyli]SDF47941.1 hypothetical protein SAMN05216377_10563 [Pseudonocardia oroxyli]
MDTPTTLIQLLLNLLSDPKAAAEFQADPQGYLATCGLTAVSPEQVHDAAALVADQHRPAAPQHHEQHHHHTPPPPVPDHHDHESAVKYLQTIVTNNWIDDRDTIVDNSVRQVIHAGGDVNQTIDNHTVVASGDGSVAAGGDISDSQVVTGDDNVFGDGNVKGDGNTTAFGDGDATHASVSDVSVDEGGAFSVTGAAAGASTTDGSFNDTTVSSTDSTSIDGSYNDSTSSHTSYDLDDHSTTTSDSNNHADVDSHNDVTSVVG